MISTNFNLLPSSSSILPESLSPLHMFLEPVAEYEPSVQFNKTIFQIPKCPHCCSYYNSNCKMESDFWECSVCGSKVHYVKAIPCDALKGDIIDVQQKENNNSFDFTLASMIDDDQ